MPFFFWCEICHRHHWSHYHQTAELLFGFTDPEGEVHIMANTIDITGSDTTLFYGSLGELTDANGTVVEDTVATASWESSDGTVATVAPSSEKAIDAVFTVTGNGTTAISVTGTTAAGNTVTGEGTTTVTDFTAPAGGAVSVAINLTVSDPDTSTAAPVEPTTVPETPAPAATIGDGVSA